MSNVKRLVEVLGRILGSAESNANKLQQPLKDDDPFVRSLNGESITVGLLRSAVRELGEGEIRIGNRAFKIETAPKAHPTHQVCELCAFANEKGMAQQSCPKMIYLEYSRSLCTFFGEGDRQYFVEIG